MAGAFHAYMNAPIPRKRALTAVMISSQAWTLMLLLAKIQKEIIEDQQQRLGIMGEIIDFLTERATTEDMRELDQKLEYWRIVRGMPREPDPDLDN